MASKNEFNKETTILLAIHKYCLHCMSGDKELIENCQAGPGSGKSQCMLWEYRQGPLSSANHAVRFSLATIRQHCIRCAGSEDNVDKCPVNGNAGYRRCGLYEYRNGNRRL